MEEYNTASNNIPYEPLTERETDILALIACGSSNREIAESLYIAHSTVRWYIRQIYSKLGAENRDEAIELAMKMGLRGLNIEPAIKHNLPVQTNVFIGRQRELNDLTEMLDAPNTRLITILGPGGMGKSRLSLEAAHQRLEQYPDGTFFISLAPLASAGHLVSAIADALDFHFQGHSEPRELLLDFLCAKHMLLILDNFEHLLAGVSLVQDILQIAPDVTLLITSREKLALASEQVYAISGMVIPDLDTVGELFDYDAVQLFVQNARLARADLQFGDEELALVAQICRLIEGMPLAILLAAAWVDVLSLTEIVEEVQQSIDFLAAEMRDLPRRQWSIQAVFEPTWKRLSEDERSVFMKFAVFRGGATREGIQTITGATLHHLKAFVNKSLLTRSPDGRYEIHELLRQYIEKRLLASGEAEATYNQHLSYYTDFLIQRESSLKGQKQAKAIRQIDAEFENVRSALNRAVARQEYLVLDLAAESLFWYSVFVGHFEVAIELLQLACRSLERESQSDTRSPIWGRLKTRLIRLAYLHYGKFQQPDEARKRLEQCLHLAQNTDNDPELALCRHLVGQLNFSHGNYDIAIGLYEQSLVVFRAHNDAFYTAQILHDMHMWAYLTGDHETAFRYGQEALEICREIGDRFGMASTLFTLVGLTMSVGELKIAEEYARQAAVFADGTHLIFGVQAQLAFQALLRGEFQAAQIMNTRLMDRSTNTLRSLRQFTKGIQVCINGDYDYARQVGEEALRTAPNGLVKFFSNWSLALAYSMLDELPSAIQANHDAIAFAFSARLLGRVTWCLPAAAMIEVHSGNGEQAIELLSLAFNHPASPTGWIEKWPVITQLRADLAAELGADAYNTAWERGKKLDLATVVEELLEKYEAV